jgi:hypothetical protein
MTQPLGLTPAQEQQYIAYLWRTHDFAIYVDVLGLDHTPIKSLGDVTGQLLDGQVNLQRDQPVARTATFTFLDPDHSLHLDPDSPWQGAYFSDRMLRVRHEVTVPGIGLVSATPFIGPITKVSRDSETLSVECQDKASLALNGGPPVKVGKGMNGVDAIRRIMANGAGENKFRLPSSKTGWAARNIHKTYATGWHDDATPWVVAQRIAGQLNAQLFYSCDGYLTLRPWPTQTSVTATGAALTSAPEVDFDSSSVRNIVRVSGTLAPPRRKNTKADAKPQLERPATKLTAVAQAGKAHPLSPARLGRNGVARYLPQIIEDQTYKSLAQARNLATTTLYDQLKLTTGVSFEMIPLFHLDVGDVIVAQAPSGAVSVRLQEGSIPLSVSGEMAVGTQRRVSAAAHARIQAKQIRGKPTKKMRKEYRHDLAAWRKSHKSKHHA